MNDTRPGFEKANRVVWSLERHSCVECGRPGVSGSVLFEGTGTKFFVFPVDNERDAIAFIQTLKKAEIVNSTEV